MIHVVAAVVSRGDTFLVARRPESKRHGLMWEFPGGKVFAGESFRDALERELAEELGVRVEGVGRTYFAAADHGSDFLIHFVAVSIDGEPHPLEHSEVRWVTAAELLTLPLAPTDSKFVNELIAVGAVREAHSTEESVVAPETPEPHT